MRTATLAESAPGRPVDQPHVKASRIPREVPMKRGESLRVTDETAQAVVYARVSSKEQEREGYSIPAQLRLLRDYALHQDLDIAQEFVDVETAKQAGRGSFGEMLKFLARNRNCHALLVEKTDRLYRNLKDWVSIDELELEIHFVKENLVLSHSSRSAEKFMHGIKVLMAKNYIDNLAEEVSKGLREKAEQGMWPSYSPLGYRNVVAEDGRHRIEPDPERNVKPHARARWVSSLRLWLPLA